MTESGQAEVVVAGHICLDVIPSFGGRGGGLETIFVPGKLVNIETTVIATGGPVANIGLALHRLGVSTRLLGKIGADLFGEAILNLLGQHDPALAEGMIVTPGEQTSYTIVISAPGVDRMFFHCCGANDNFGADDVADVQLADVRLFHFGYPPVMRRMYTQGGHELAVLFRRVKEQGLTTSLDMSTPDPESESGHVDWQALLERVLPYVDVFLPSLEEILFMLDRERFTHIAQGIDPADGSLLSDLAEQLLQMGAAIVGLKLGEQGLYLRTTADRTRLAAIGRGAPLALSSWQSRELLAPSFQANVVGTTGAGDCTIAAFLTGLLRGLPPETVMRAAVGAGAFNVERADATSGVPSWTALQARIQAGWEQRPLTVPLPGWQWDAEDRIWMGPDDMSSNIGTYDQEGSS